MADLTLFSTIASASASFVAIIGGLIASKLITINGERESINTQLRDLDEVIAMKVKEEALIKEELEDDDALEYILDHIEEIESKTPLSDVYETDEPQRLEFVVLEEYWKIAIDLYEKFQSVWSEDCETNSDGIPVELAAEWSSDDFMYSLCKRFTQLDSGVAWALRQSLTATEANVNWYNARSKERSAVLREIDALKLQREQLERRKLSLVQPANMKWGLRIFSGIIVTCILLPLLLMKLIPIFPQIAACAETTCITLAAIGLISTIIYMYSLLRWKAEEPEGKNDNE